MERKNTAKQAKSTIAYMADGASINAHTTQLDINAFLFLTHEFLFFFMQPVGKVVVISGLACMEFFRRSAPATWKYSMMITRFP